MPISLFSFLFSLFGNEKCGGTKHQSFFLSLPTTTTNPRRRVLWTIAERRLPTVRFLDKRSILGYPEYSVGAITCNPLMSTLVPSGWILCTAECWILSAMMNNVEAPLTPPSPQTPTPDLPISEKRLKLEIWRWQDGEDLSQQARLQSWAAPNITDNVLCFKCHRTSHHGIPTTF